MAIQNIQTMAKPQASPENKGKYALLTEEWMDLGGTLKTRSPVEEAGLQVVAVSHWLGCCWEETFLPPAGW